MSIVGAIHGAKLTAPVSFRDLLQFRPQALGVEHQRARVAAQQVASVRAHLAEVVVILSSTGEGPHKKSKIEPSIVIQYQAQNVII